jgi:hypothetical protein
MRKPHTLPSAPSSACQQMPGTIHTSEVPNRLPVRNMDARRRRSNHGRDHGDDHGGDDGPLMRQLENTMPKASAPAAAR